MKEFLNSSVVRWTNILTIIVGNIAFYTWGYPESGAKYAWDIHPLFYLMWQLIFLYAIVGLIVMWYKKW